MKRTLLIALIGLMFSLFLGCASRQETQTLMPVHVTADGETIELEVPVGSTVQKVLEIAEIELESLDRTIPSEVTVLGEDAKVRIVRVQEEFEIEEVVMPFEQQTVRNESMASGSEMLIQKGVNGLKEITYRRVYEDDVEVSSEPIAVKSVIVKEPQPEIRMVGVQAPFAPLAICGEIIYLRDSNVWRIKESTHQREALLTLGDLDGRVFSVSEDGEWLLFTRLADVEGRINELWVANIAEIGAMSEEEAIEAGILIDLEVRNVIHFADWVPGTNTKVIFSTVEPRNSPPGWQANNDLQVLTFSTSGWTTKWVEVLEANSGGIYGWWGTEFTWSPNSDYLAFARPDSIGLVDYATGAMTTTMKITPLQPQGDWAWVPGTSWGPDGKTIYTTDHVYQESAPSPEESPLFDLSALPLEAPNPIHLVNTSGMFTYPISSPLQISQAGELDYQIAYLQAIYPQQSLSSRYRLAVMDRDGSNRREIFPSTDNAGIDPLKNWGAWSPDRLPDSQQYAIAALYQGNLWIVEVEGGSSTQVTGDGLTTRILWRALPEVLE